MSEDEFESPEAAQPTRPGDHRGRAAAAARMEQQQTWVDLQVRQAMQRGDFDNLPGKGKPLASLGSEHDPDWWLKQLVQREQITGVLPEAIALRKVDAELDGVLDGLSSERVVRERVAEFNARVLRARYTPVDGPPLITGTRDIEETVAAWRQRLAERRARAATRPPTDDETSRRSWWRRRPRR